MSDVPSLPEGTELLVLTPEKAAMLWSKLSEIPGLFDDFTVNRPDIFLQGLLAPDSVWLERSDGNGILYLRNVKPGLSASGHIVYWDKRLRGREEFTKNVMRWLMRNIPLQKINLWLPDYSQNARAFAERCGFKEEGCIRKWSYSNGRLYDIYAYGITQEEAFEEESDGPVLRADSNELRSEESGIREQHDGLDQPAPGDEQSSDPAERTSSE